MYPRYIGRCERCGKALLDLMRDDARHCGDCHKLLAFAKWSAKNAQIAEQDARAREAREARKP